MFCFQCEETAKGEGCTNVGVCGKKGEVADLQDMLRYLLKGISICNTKTRESGDYNEEVDKFIMDSLFSTITNVNFDPQKIKDRIIESYRIKDKAKKLLEADSTGLHGPAILLAPVDALTFW